MSAVEGAQDLASVVRRYGALLDIAESVASRQELPEVLQDLASRLQPVVSFELIQLALYDSDRTILRQQWVTMEGAASVEDVSVESSAAGPPLCSGRLTR